VKWGTIRLSIPSKIATLFFQHVKASQLALATIPVSLYFIFLFFYFEKLNLRNNLEMSYDNIQDANKAY
jgi:hypothetical protein